MVNARLGIGAVLISVAIAGWGQARIHPRYELILPEVPPEYSYGQFSSVNSCGQIAGTVVIQNPFAVRAVVSGKYGGALQFLNARSTLNETTFANAVNVHGDVGSGDGWAVVWWAKTGYERIEPRYNSSVSSINDRGDVVGMLFGPDPVPFHWSRRRGLSKLALPPATTFDPLEISDEGLVLGRAYRFGLGFPAIWSEVGGLKELPLPPGALEGGVGSVNSSGQMVGGCSGPDGRVVCVWAEGKVFTLPTPSGAYASGIDDRGWIVGRDASEVTVIWTDWNKPPIRMVELVTPSTRITDRILYTQSVADHGHVLAFCSVDGGKLLPCLLRALD